MFEKALAQTNAAACIAYVPSYGQTVGLSRNYFDDKGRLTAVTDSSGNQIGYTYDSAGNIITVVRGLAPDAGTLAILNFTPQSGPIGTTITIQGQNFSTTPANNTLTINGVPATVLTATTSTLTAAVPAGATTGPITITFASATATSVSSFTVIASPAVSSISPQFSVSSSTATTIPTFAISGANLTGASFSFVPVFSSVSIAVNSASVGDGGTSATLSLTIAANVKGTFTLVAANASGSSSIIPNSSNTLQVIDPNGDTDGDGVSNAVEIAIGTNPLNAQTCGQGISDGWQVF